MSVHAITPDYHGDIKDARDKFHGNIIVYVGWDHHVMFCSSKALPLPPSMPFSAIIENIMPEAFAQHPEFSSINWETAGWLLDGNPFMPDLDKTLEQQGIAHKSLLRLVTPELKGYQSAGI